MRIYVPCIICSSGAGCGFSCNLVCLPSHPASAADVCGVFGGVPQPGRAGRVSVFSRLPQEVSLNSDEEAPFQLVQRVVFLQVRCGLMVMADNMIIEILPRIPKYNKLQRNKYK